MRLSLSQSATVADRRAAHTALADVLVGQRAETGRRRSPEAWDQLTPQELEIASLAAEGLSNREIGQRLLISHRTVGCHLHRIFPKLGINSRSQLHAVLSLAGKPSW